MKNRKRLVAILAGIMALIMVFGLIANVIPMLVGAEEEEKTLDQLQAEIDKLKEELKASDEKIEEFEGKLSANMTEMKQIVEQKNIIDQQVFVLYEKITNINAQINVYNALIADKQEELDAAREKYAQLNAKNKERIRAMEEDGTLSYWSVLFKANNFADLLDRLNMVEEIAASDQRRLKEMRAAAAVVERAKASLESEKTALESAKADLDASQKDLEAKREEADKLLGDLIAYDEEYQIYLEEAGHISDDLQAQIDKVEQEYKELDEKIKREEEERKKKLEEERLAQLAKDQQQAIKDALANGGWLVPVTYTYFSSPFGYRIHPVYGDWRFHAGVDLAAPSGTPIRATRSGKVAIATYDSSAGYYVNINHLDGFTSRYLHMTHYVVSAGDYVAVGDIIGYVGSTGTSTGPHLHFGIYYNGVAQNPADYISIR